MPIAGHDIRYDGVATHTVAPVTQALQSLSLVTFGCAFYNRGPSSPYHIAPECSLEDTVTGAVYPTNGFQQAGNDDAVATGAYVLAHHVLQLCIRAHVTPTLGAPAVAGHRICAPLA